MDRDELRRRWREQKRKWREEHKRLGLCKDCCNPVSPRSKTRCEACLERDREDHRIRIDFYDNLINRTEELLGYRKKRDGVDYADL